MPGYYLLCHPPWSEKSCRGCILLEKTIGKPRTALSSNSVAPRNITQDLSRTRFNDQYRHSLYKLHFKPSIFYTHIKILTPKKMFVWIKQILSLMYGQTFLLFEYIFCLDEAKLLYKLNKVFVWIENILIYNTKLINFVLPCYFFIVERMYFIEGADVPKNVTYLNAILRM